MANARTYPHIPRFRLSDGSVLYRLPCKNDFVWVTVSKDGAVQRHGPDVARKMIESVE